MNNFEMFNQLYNLMDEIRNFIDANVDVSISLRGEKEEPGFVFTIFSDIKKKRRYFRYSFNLQDIEDKLFVNRLKDTIINAANYEFRQAFAENDIE